MLRWISVLALLTLVQLGCSSATTGEDDSGSAGDDDGADDDDADDDGADDDADDDTAGVEHDYECVSVGSGYSDGFFALRGFGGKLYAGLFGYGHEGESMLYSYPPWELVQPGLTGVSESVCAMLEFGGYLYANTESSADIFRSADGVSWERVHDGPGSTIGCGLEAMGGYLYAINYGNGAQEHGRILRSTDGNSWDIVWDSGSDSWYIREITSHGGTLHAFVVDQDTDQGYRLSSTNGIDWTSATTPSRIFRGHSHNGTLWLASTDRSSNGASGVWAFDGSQMTQVHHESRHYVTEITSWDSSLFAGTSDGWKEDEGTSALLMSRDGASWEEVCQFSEIAAWSIAVAGDYLYVGTWEYEHGGQVFQVQIVEVPADDDDDDTGGDVDCSLITQANPAWEVCETGPQFCAGTFADGAGCEAYCAPVGLPCTARYGGEPGCDKEPDYVQNCSDDSGHDSDWCDCGWAP